MIRIKRTAQPQLLQAAEVEGLRTQVRKFYQERKEHARRQERPDFPFFPTLLFTELLDAMLGMSHGKCAYCETRLSQSDNASLDRFRPKAGAVGLSGEFSSEHYWWLAYEWNNLYPSCASCNRVKGPKFPVDGSRAPIDATAAQLAAENRLLVDPCAEDPADHFTFEGSGVVKPRSPRGEVTIETFNLNRGDLVAQRRAVAAEFLRALARLHRTSSVTEFLSAWIGSFPTAQDVVAAGDIELDHVRQWIRPDQPCAAVARALLTDWLATRQASIPSSRKAAKASRATDGEGAIQASVPVIAGEGQVTLPYGRKASHKKISAKARRLSTQTITRIALKNYRGIRDLDFHINVGSGPGAPWLILLGENGTGKSSILQAVALALIDGKVERTLDVTPKEVLRQGEQRGWVKVWIGDAPTPRVLEFGRGQRRFRRSGPPFYPVLLGYGATRLLPRRSSTAPHGRTRLENMFDPFRPLLDANHWLGGLGSRSFDYAARALKDVLDLPASSRLKRVKREGRRGVTLELFRAHLTLDQLSDGYQSVLGLTCDMMSGLRLAGPEALEAAEGLVVLDELGAHLHPRWRMRIVASLRKAFPRVQFLVTTHDPLCLRGLEDNEAAVLRRTAKGRIHQVPELPPLKGLRVEQLLTSQYFGLDSTMDPTVEVKFRRLYYLLALREVSPKQEAEIARLREELAPHDIRGSTRREQRLLEILDRELARVDQEADPARRTAIRQESEAQITKDLNMMLSAAPPNP